MSSDAREPSGQVWCSRFLQSTNLDDLVEPFKTNAKQFIGALRNAGVSVRISTTYRPIERSYLMYHASQIARGLEHADRVPVWTGERRINIDWAHRDNNGLPDLVRARNAAQEMVDGYQIGSNPVAPPRNSNHNRKLAVDMRISNFFGKNVLDAHGDSVEVNTFADLKRVGSTYSVFHKLDDDPPHWSITGR
ncbi:hypothetical protein BTH42_28585 [Burkholderia sp. SRS-W-2-2016]|nr:hypothetical protein BTH42_28585 [Burkholderia sp. SRS-W-2-2016]